MAYNKTNWKTGDVISAEKLNNIEDGVAGAGSIPDWNQNDENADGYIKNRPFYKGDEDITILIPETTIALIGGSAHLEVEDDGAAWDIAKDNVGKVVKIQYNDVIDDHIPILFFDEGDIKYYKISNFNVDININHTGYFIMINNLDTENVVLHVSIDNTKINKISSNYLPFPAIEGTGTSSIILNGSLSGCNADGEFAVAEGSFTTASGYDSHAEGGMTKASGNHSHAEGNNTTASEEFSHAEGNNTTASGQYSHAECYKTTASGHGSHAEGHNTTASGVYSHAEGDKTTASGLNSHAEGNTTVANHASQHVFGEYNVSDPSAGAATTKGTYVEIVGNGSSSTKRSNARTLDWSGNEALQGSLTLGKGTADETTVTAAQLKALLNLLNS